MRIKGRRASEGLIGVVFPQEEQYNEVAKVIEKKKVLKEEYAYDLPVMKDRMEYSFIWDRFTLYEAANATE